MTIALIFLSVVTLIPLHAILKGLPMVSWICLCPVLLTTAAVANYPTVASASVHKLPVESSLGERKSKIWRSWNRKFSAPFTLRILSGSLDVSSIEELAIHWCFFLTQIAPLFSILILFFDDQYESCLQCLHLHKPCCSHLLCTQESKLCHVPQHRVKCSHLEQDIVWIIIFLSVAQPGTKQRSPFHCDVPCSAKSSVQPPLKDGGSNSPFVFKPHIETMSLFRTFISTVGRVEFGESAVSDLPITWGQRLEQWENIPIRTEVAHNSKAEQFVGNQRNWNSPTIVFQSFADHAIFLSDFETLKLFYFDNWTC